MSSVCFEAGREGAWRRMYVVWGVTDRAKGGSEEEETDEKGRRRKLLDRGPKPAFYTFPSRPRLTPLLEDGEGGIGLTLFLSSVSSCHAPSDPAR